jgi:bifunctional DNA-binding transcriptional regulator/antitoxin component of YhaV-PrlF toxin-antitoxin module
MAQVIMGDKGRIVIPLSERSAAGVDIGDELIVRAVAEGQIMLETRAAVARRIKARFAGGDGTPGLRKSRAADAALDEQRRNRKAARGGRDRDAERRRGEEILVALGVLIEDERAS